MDSLKSKDREALYFSIGENEPQSHEPSKITYLTSKKKGGGKKGLDYQSGVWWS